MQITNYIKLFSFPSTCNLWSWLERRAWRVCRTPSNSSPPRTSSPFVQKVTLGSRKNNSFRKGLTIKLEGRAGPLVKELFLWLPFVWLIFFVNCWSGFTRIPNVKCWIRIPLNPIRMDFTWILIQPSKIQPRSGFGSGSFFFFSDLRFLST